MPVAEIVPPVADQVTAVFDVPVTVAENCFVFPACTEVGLGLTETATVGVAGGGGAALPPPQPGKLSNTNRRKERLAATRRNCV
jgi:hypothetical protein